MLELRLTSDAKRIAAMRDAIRCECERSRADPDHAARVALVVEQLVGLPDAQGGRRVRARRPGDVFVIVTVQSDATMLMIRDTRPEIGGLGDRRRQLMEEHTSRWSTMSGRDGRTVWAEVARAATPQPAVSEPVRTSVAAEDPIELEPRQVTPTASPRVMTPPVATNA